MEEFKLNEQELLINKLILNEELKERYKGYGLCKECKQPNISIMYWCKSCNSKHFQQNFKNWTSGNDEWIEYNRFKNVEYLAKGGFGTIYKAIWKDGYILVWDSENNQWKRKKNWMGHVNFTVVLKYLIQLIEWINKVQILKKITKGLNSIHEKGLIHRDFHCGNMLKDDDWTIITDLGL
ncbi:hypothetical protein C1646_706370, partial [Rhizophagus diaphanus]